MSTSNPSRFVRTWIEIDARALRANYRRFQTLARGAVVMAVVKSNAYGHGLTLVAKFLANLTPNTYYLKPALWFGVDSIVEALRLRREGIRQSILVLGYTLPGRYADAARRGIVVTVSNFEALEALARTRRKPDFHLKLDTGMHRQGFQEREIPQLIAVLKRFSLTPAGVYSHFAWESKTSFSNRQMAGFGRCLRVLSAAGIRPLIRHLSRTGAIARYPEANHGLVRIGLGLYGYPPDPRAGLGRLKPVMTWKTLVSEVKRVSQGDGIGYDLTERVRRDTDVAILPIGYWHGFDRGLSSVGEVLVRGRRCRVLGLVSMDMTAIDVTGVRGARIGDEVVLIGRQGREFIGADEVAGKIDTTAYEVLTRVNPLIKRILK